MAKKQFQVDGIGINAEYYAGWKEADFVKDIIGSIPDKFGTDAQKTDWAKGAFALVQKQAPAKDEVKAKG